MDESLEEWVMNQPNADKINDHLYKFRYKGIECAGIVTVSIFYGLDIRPIKSTEDIGLGAGQMAHKIFKKK